MPPKLRAEGECPKCYSPLSTKVAQNVYSTRRRVRGDGKKTEVTVEHRMCEECGTRFVIRKSKEV